MVHEHLLSLKGLIWNRNSIIKITLPALLRRASSNCRHSLTDWPRRFGVIYKHCNKIYFNFQLPLIGESWECLFSTNKPFVHFFDWKWSPFWGFSSRNFYMKMQYLFLTPPFINLVFLNHSGGIYGSENVTDEGEGVEDRGPLLGVKLWLTALTGRRLFSLICI